jgi:hypothetical protein
MHVVKVSKFPQLLSEAYAGLDGISTPALTTAAATAIPSFARPFLRQPLGEGREDVLSGFLMRSA